MVTLPAYTAHYTVYAKGMHVGSTVENLKWSGNKFTYTSKTKVHVLFFGDNMTSVSRGSVANGKVVTSQFTFDDTKNNHIKIIFNHLAKTATYADGKKAPITLPMKVASFDGLSYEMQMRYDVLNHKKVFNYQVMHQGEWWKKRFHVFDHVKLKTPMGVLDTTELVSQPLPDGTRVGMWFDNSRHALLVQTQTEKGTKVTGLVTIASYQK